jgi:PTH1 family peptidyl-tRNA hydrolase
VGFDTVAELARRHAVGSVRSAFEAEMVEAELAGERALLLRPQTYMNRSGTSVVRARDFYKLRDDDLLVVGDDFNLPLARLRVRAKGSAGGQKGLDDIIRCLGTSDIARLRIGIGPVPGRWDPADFVLSRFTAEERQEIDVAIVRAADAVVHWAAEGIAACMNRYNVADDKNPQDKHREDKHREPKTPADANPGEAKKPARDGTARDGTESGDSPA